MNPLRLDIQPGAERHLPFAKELLRQLKWNLNQRGLLNGDHRTKVGDVDIYVQTAAGVDLIRLRGGGGVLVFLYNTAGQVLVLLLSESKSGMGAKPVDRSITVVRRYGSKGATSQYNPSKKEHIVDMSADTHTDTMEYYGIRTSPAPTEDDRRYCGTIYHYRPGWGAASYSLIETSIQDAYDWYNENAYQNHEPVATGRHNYTLDHEGQLVLVDHSIWIEMSGPDSPKRYVRKTRGSAGEWVGYGMLGEDEAEPTHSTVYVPIATISASKTLYIKRDTRYSESTVNLSHSRYQCMIDCDRYRTICPATGNEYEEFVNCQQIEAWSTHPSTLTDKTVNETTALYFGDFLVESGEKAETEQVKGLAVILDGFSIPDGTWYHTTRLYIDNDPCHASADFLSHESESWCGYDDDGLPSYDMPDPATGDGGGKILAAARNRSTSGAGDFAVIGYDHKPDIDNPENTFILFYKKAGYDNSSEIMTSFYVTDSFYKSLFDPTYDIDPYTDLGHKVLVGDKEGTGQISVWPGNTDPEHGVYRVPVYDNSKVEENTQYVLSYRLNGGDIQSIILAETVTSQVNAYSVTSVSDINVYYRNAPFRSATATFNFTRTITSASTSGNRASKVSCQVHKNYIAYTYVLEIYNETSKEWEFSKRSLGIIRISDGFRQEFDIDDALLSEEPYSSFDYQSLSAVGIQE